MCVYRLCFQEPFDFSETPKCLQERASVLLVGSACAWRICRDITVKFTDVTEDKPYLKNSKLTEYSIYFNKNNTEIQDNMIMPCQLFILKILLT